MSVIYVLLAISISVALVFFAAFVFSVKRGQYDDSYTPSVRMLFEDELLPDLDKNEPENKEIELTKSTNQ
ncbi:cbb3-type cytochrome oxidase assembly protein CcoS [Flagellimonas hymeniacidonis]|uniref:Cbb3-type cytochrome oxidase assembly protein CcoS n=1 Tax=Flagellimonas hymeniacidonis TaxID=2603628 RepID=A0A5C8V5K1_9FLAO|nr:cbb3-type cytochrome oxidase assembly protein CcoS [Flagellimonas hymeniacidonis]TXN37155.1 cbb3-type cytochrome oxidase assembly protein CcoS [Flagellimonas hymeniacidonis]